MEREEFNLTEGLSEDVVNEIEKRIDNIRIMNQLYEYEQLINFAREQSEQAVQALMDTSIILSITLLVFIIWPHWATKVFLVVNGFYAVFAVVKLGVMYWFIKHQRKNINKLTEEGEDYYGDNYTD